MIFRLAFLASALLALGMAAPARALDNGAQIGISPPVPDVGTVLHIAIEGVWPDACTPTLESARIVGRDIVLRATLAADNCPGEARRYRIDTEKLPPLNLRLVANGFYRVRYEVQRRESGPAEVHGFRLLWAGNDPQQASLPETGFWWPENGGEFEQAGPGLGLQMETQARTLSVSAFGYADDGEANWYFGAGEVTGPTAQIELSRLDNGSGPFAPYRKPEGISAVGSMHLELISPSRVVAWFVRPRAEGAGLQLQPVSMVRFRFAQQPAEAWLGPWIVLAESGEAMPAVRVEFVSIERRDDGFGLRDANGKHELRCIEESARPNSPPQSCTLITTLDGVSTSLDFGQVALNEMRGWNGNSQRMVAIKLGR